MFGMNFYTLQMNYMSDQLKQKLPPTDCRLRGDMRAWEQADMDRASAEKARLEQNQRVRRAKVKEMISRDSNRLTSWRIDDERTYYSPAFFEKRLLSG